VAITGGGMEPCTNLILDALIMASAMSWIDSRRHGMLFSACIGPVHLPFVGQSLDGNIVKRVQILPTVDKMKKKRRYCRQLWK